MKGREDRLPGMIIASFEGDGISNSHQNQTWPDALEI